MALDGLRGAAAVYVVLFHVNWQTHLSRSTFIANGFLAVDLFFVLSGFVIATVYGRRIADGLDFTRFMLRRFFRLYPLHLFVLACFLALETARAVWVGLGHPPNGPMPFAGERGLDLVAAHLFLVQGLGFNGTIGWNAPSWSISCEFAAYVAFGLLALAAASRGRGAAGHGAAPAAAPQPRDPGVGARGLMLALAALAALALYWPIAVGAFGTFSGSARCAAGFTLGACIAGLVRRPSWRRLADGVGTGGLAAAQLAVAATVLAILAFVSGPWAFAVVPLFGAALLLLVGDVGPLAVPLTTATAQFLGRISYSVYMVHVFVVIPFTFALKRLPGSGSFSPLPDGRLLMLANPAIGDVLMVVYLAVVLLVSTATYRYVEAPGRALGQRLTDGPGYRRRAAAGRQAGDATAVRALPADRLEPPVRKEALHVQ
ncbi:acyltransferase family protein [Chelatococcus reniformis]|uniref:acyltransferase family protein n=1 Tax=Chelatococcus reniformis TaxID=1494448 RepID=UPI00166EB218|nr:acyltransferase [Chelatococcus reniformis]